MRKPIRYYLLLILPAVLFFSYYPIITLGTNDTMNLELSLPEIWLALFSLVSLPYSKKLWRQFGWKNILLAFAIPLYFSLSIIWSGNRLRAILTTGLLWLIAFSILNILQILRDDHHKNGSLREKLYKAILIPAVIVSLFCWLQSILDVVGVARENTLLCLGCTSQSFGFPHPNGFAIEPQFMGNLLIVPTLLCYYLLNAPVNKKQKKSRVHLIVLTLFLSATIFFTFSRGAIYAFAIGLIAEQLLMIRFTESVKSKSVKKSKFWLVPILFCSAFAISLSIQGLFSTIGPTNDTFFSGITKSIHQLSLGKIDLRPDNIKNESSGAQNDAPSDSMNDSQDEVQDDSRMASFSGYVAESTERRLDLNQYAVDTWKSSVQYIWIGAGIGSAGVAMNKYMPEIIGAKEIVQNEYVSLLLETGVIGCVVVITVGCCVARKIWKYNSPRANPLFWSAILSFALTMLFFSGLPNALQIYLLPPLLLSRK